jgi:hypothetical protein
MSAWTTRARYNAVVVAETAARLIGCLHIPTAISLSINWPNRYLQRIEENINDLRSLQESRKTS